MIIEAVDSRLVEPASIDELALVMERANAQRDNIPIPVTVSSQAIEHVKVRLDRIKAHAHAAIQGEKVVGFALSHPLIETQGILPEEVDTEHLALLMIDPDYWGKQIASRLLALTIQHTVDNGRRRLTLWTRKADNARAREFYAHTGFTLAGAETVNEQGRQVQYQLDLMPFLW